MTIIIIEVFGSPFMRNASVVLALLFGYLIAAVVPSLSTGASFVSTATIQAAPVVTFLWTTTFPLGALSRKRVLIEATYCVGAFLLLPGRLPRAPSQFPSFAQGVSVCVAPGWLPSSFGAVLMHEVSSSIRVERAVRGTL